jgi:hypothetical protein
LTPTGRLEKRTFKPADEGAAIYVFQFSQQ